MSLPPEVEASYSAIIDQILAKSDLDKVSRKSVRKELSVKVGQDLSSQKDAINDIIDKRFDKLSNPTNGTSTTNGHVEPAPTANGIVKSVEQPTPSPSPSPTAKRSAPSDSDLSDVIDEPKPKKKRTKATSAEDDDAAFAAKLQAEENSRARPTRGGTTKKRAPVKKDKSAAKAKKKKSAARVKADDDSELSSGSEKEPKEKKGGFHKPMTLSEPLAALLDETQLSRPQTVKKIWEYVKARELQDPSDKRQIRCDDAMRAVFKVDRVHMFTMNKILNQNLYAVDE